MKMTTEVPLNLEEVFENIGGFGRFQFIILIILLFFEIPASFLPFLPLFIGGSPIEWVCNNETINATLACDCSGPLLISESDHYTSFVVEWQLICGSTWVADFISSLQMLGMFVGTIVGCQISDWYGRRYTFLAMIIFMIFGQSLSALATSPYVYGVAKFTCGIGLSGYLGIAAIYTMEFQTAKWRQLCGSVGPWGEGLMILALIAYFVRPWRHLVFATTAPLALVFIVFPFIPESPRWLLRNHKLKEAHEVICYIAKVNGKDPTDMESLKRIMISETKEAESTLSGVKQFSYLDFFRDNSLRLPTIYQMIIMCCTAITYYGISFNVKNMKGSPYLIVSLMGLSDSIGYPSALLISNRLGRRTSLALYMTFGALFLVTLAILQLTLEVTNSIPIVVVTLCLMGKLFVAGGRSCARTLVGETYPTAVRAMGSGLGGAGASLGGVLAPQLAFLGSKWISLPYFVFAVIAIIGALISLLMAETMGRPLRDEVSSLKENINTIVESNLKVKSQTRRSSLGAQEHSLSLNSKLKRISIISV